MAKCFLIILKTKLPFGFIINGFLSVLIQQHHQVWITNNILNVKINSMNKTDSYEAWGLSFTTGARGWGTWRRLLGNKTYKNSSIQLHKHTQKRAHWQKYCNKTGVKLICHPMLYGKTIYHSVFIYMMRFKTIN